MVFQKLFLHQNGILFYQQFLGQPPTSNPGLQSQNQQTEMLKKGVLKTQQLKQENGRLPPQFDHQTPG